MGVETMMMAAAVASAASSTLEGVDAYNQGRYRASVLRQQADAARRDAGTEIQLTLEDQARLMGQGIVRAGRDGGVTGSAFDVLADLSRQGSYEVQRLAVQGDNAARAAEAEAKQAKRQGTISLITGLVKAGASLAGAPNAAGDGTLLSDAMAKRAARGASHRMAAGGAKAAGGGYGRPIDWSF